MIPQRRDNLYKYIHYVPGGAKNNRLELNLIVYNN
jgi:hypothetical protein